jgi:hypothetical protein
LLPDTVQRKWLLLGIMMKILEVKVFHEDLWAQRKKRERVDV